MLKDAIGTAREALDECFASVEDEGLDEQTSDMVYAALNEAEQAFDLALRLARRSDD